MMNDITMTMMEMTMAPMPVNNSRRRITDNSRRTSQATKSDESSQPSIRRRRHNNSNLLISHDDLLKILPVVQPRRRQSLAAEHHSPRKDDDTTTAFKMIGTGSVSCCSPDQFKCMKRRFTVEHSSCVKAKSSFSAQRSWRNLRSLSLINTSSNHSQQQQPHHFSSSTSFTASSSEAIVAVTSNESSCNKKLVHKVLTMLQKYQWSKLQKFFGLNHSHNSKEIVHHERIVKECWKQMTNSQLLLFQMEYTYTTETATNTSKGSHIQEKASFSDTKKESTSLLHVMCQGHPPLDIIKYFMNACPFELKRILEMSDPSNKHTPLHIAAKHGANPKVVQYLLKDAPYVAAWKDVEGKTPLHLHCESTCGQLGTCDPHSFSNAQHKDYAQRVHHEKIQQFLVCNDYYYCNQKDESCHDHDYDTERFMTYGPIWNVVKMLHEASPTSINDEDSKGCNPIEYCLFFDQNDNSKPSATQQVVLEYTKEMLQKIQRLSIQQWNTVGNNRSRGIHPPMATATAQPPVDVQK